MMTLSEDDDAHDHSIRSRVKETRDTVGRGEEEGEPRGRLVWVFGRGGNQRYCTSRQLHHFSKGQGGSSE